MILIHTALFFEANPIIQYLKLHFVTKKPFKIYQNDKYILIISGIGGQNTIKALGYVYEKYAINYAINIGIAGTKDKQLKIGDLIQVRDNILTVDTPLDDASKLNKQLVDMEYQYFYDISSSYNIPTVSYKVVSDYLDITIPKKQFVYDIIYKNLPKIFIC